MKETVLKALVVLGAVLSVYWMGVLKGEQNGATKALNDHVVELRRIEKERDDVQAELNQTARNWAEDQARSESTARSLADRLAESGIRLRVKTADATRAEVEGYNRGVSDGKAELHRETSEALIRITQDADRHVQALQDTIKEVTRER